MRISFLSVFPPYRGGISEHSSLIYKHLIKNNKVQALNFKKLYPSLFFPGKTQYNVSSKESIGSRVIDSVNFISWIKTVDYICKYKPDLLIFKFWHPFFAPCYNFIIKRVKAKYAINVIMICDNIYPHEKFPFARKIIKKLADNVDAFIVQSSIVEKELHSLINAPVYEKVNHPIYDSYPLALDKDSAKKRIDIVGEKIVLFFGIIRSYKGLDILIKSMEKVFENDSQIRLLIVGECYSNKNLYMKLINSSNHKDRIVWVDKFVEDSDVSAYFSAADVVVLPYRTASQSGVIPLAYHYNKPVITSDLESLVEVVKDGKTGLIYNSDKEEDLCLKILDFFKNHKSGLYEKNIIEYKQSFSWDDFEKSIIRITDILNERS